jgi:hypothetical protein
MPFLENLYPRQSPHGSLSGLFAKAMLEIETSAGWLSVQTLGKPVDGCDGPGVFYVPDDPTLPAHQALLQVEGRTALFRPNGRRTQKCFVEFNKVPVLLEKQIACCTLRLTPVK